MRGDELSNFQLDHDVPQLIRLKQEQVDEELLTLHLETDLPTDECATELSQGVLQPRHQRILQFAFPSVPVEAEEIEDVRIPQDLSSLIGVETVEMTREVVGCSPDPGPQIGGNVMFQDFPGPATHGRLVGIPVTGNGVVEFEQDGDLAPGQSSNSLLDD